VVCDNAAGLSLEECLTALTTLVLPTDITFASRISQGRTCVYLRTAELAEMVASSPPIAFKDKSVRFRKYVSGATRIFLSNAIPDIPARVLHDHLSRYGRVVAPITFVKVAVKNPLFAHVRAFRRVAHVVVENLATLPVAIPVSFGGATHTVFLNLDDHTCTSCGRNGHHQARCTVAPPATPATEQTGAGESPEVATQSPSPPAAPIPHEGSLPVASNATDVSSGTPTLELGTTCPPALAAPAPLEGAPLGAVGVSGAAPETSPLEAAAEPRPPINAAAGAASCPAPVCASPGGGTVSGTDLPEKMAVDAPSPQSLKRAPGSPPAEPAKRAARVTAADCLREGGDRISVSSEDSTTGAESPPSGSQASAVVPDNLFKQAMRECPSRSELLPYLRRLGVDPLAFNRRVCKTFGSMTPKERGERQGKRYSTLMVRLAEELCR
jgi:hypothetical protein